MSGHKPRQAAPPRPRLRRLAATLGFAGSLAVGGVIVWLEAWQGPTLFAVSGEHGVDTGDLLAFPFLVLAVAIVRRSIRPARTSSAVAAPAVALGVLLLLPAVGGTGGGGSLIPAGGMTLDGTIAQTIADVSAPVGRWTNVALTYDGARQRLYVNGRMVKSRAAAGRIQTPGTPLWIGGNHPYGEHFEGLLDDIRVYNRALSQREIRRDMRAPVRPARGLEAGYAFDASSGTRAADSSGNHNTGEILGATWARGRDGGGALRFNGRDTLVRVPPSPSLSPTRAVTLSGWSQPSRRQTGWRAMVQRETDAYFLTASSGGQPVRYGEVDDARAALVVLAAIWFAVMFASGGSATSAARRRTWWGSVALFVLGSFADAALAPRGTLVGLLLVMVWLAATSTGPTERTRFLLAAAGCGAVTAASLAGFADPLSNNDGATVRTSALGVLFVLAGLVALAPRPRCRLGRWRRRPRT